MNRIYKVVWSKAKNCCVVVSELAKRNTKGGGTRFLGRAAVTLGIVAGLTVGMTGSVWAESHNVTYDSAKYQLIADNNPIFKITGGSAGLILTDSPDSNKGMMISVLSGIEMDTRLRVNEGGVVVTKDGLTVKDGGAAITGNSTVTGTLNTTDKLTVAAGGVEVTAGGLTVKDGGAAITGDSKVIGKLEVTGATTLNDALTVKGDTKVGDHFAVKAEDGSMSAAGGNFTVDASGNTAAKGTLNVTGATTTNGIANTGDVTTDTLTTTGKATIGGTLGVKGDTKVGDRFTVTAADGSMNAAGGNFTVDASGNTAAAGTLKVTGATTLNDTLTVKGDTKVGDNFTVTAADGSMSAANGNFTVDADGNTFTAGSLDVTGATTLHDTLYVAGATKVGETLEVTGATTLNDTLTVKGDTEVKGNLKVGGEALFNEGKTNQIKIDDSGIRIGLHSGQIDDEGFYAGGHSWNEAKAAMGADGRIKGTQFMVNGKTYIDKDGLNANHQKIRNLAPGEIAPDSTDAVIGSQVYDLSREVRRVGAGAAAMANLRPVDMGNKFSMALGVGNYRDETAMAAGLFYRPTDRIMFNMSGTIGNSNNMIGGGISFALDKVVRPVGGAAAAEIKALKAENAEIKAELAELKAAIKAMKEAK